jgi:hypothetical protein
MIAALSGPATDDRRVGWRGLDPARAGDRISVPAKNLPATTGAESKVVNVHLHAEKHDYGPSKRAAVYRFVADQFGLSLAPVLDHDGNIDESRVTIERHGPMHTFSAEHPLPAGALHDIAAVEAGLRMLQR